MYFSFKSCMNKNHNKIFKLNDDKTEAIKKDNKVIKRGGGG